MVNIVDVCVVKDVCLTGLRWAIARTSGLLALLSNLDTICLDEVEDFTFGCNMHWSTKHALLLVLIQLEPL